MSSHCDLDQNDAHQCPHVCLVMIQREAGGHDLIFSDLYKTFCLSPLLGCETCDIWSIVYDKRCQTLYKAMQYSLICTRLVVCLHYLAVKCVITGVLRIV